MALNNKTLESVEMDNLQALMDNQVQEGKTIDYKESLPGNSDSDKKEFLADISSFANAAGGFVIIGVEEHSGIPVKLIGLRNTDADAAISRLENIIRDGIEPRIPGLLMRAVPLATSKVAIVICIQRSWALPHVVNYKGHWRFYSRNSNGKYPLDVSEVRGAFALSETTAERMRNFRTERLSMVVTGEAPIPVGNTPKIALHIMPFSAFDAATRFDLLLVANHIEYLFPLEGGISGHRFNFDGFLTYDLLFESPATHSYLQIFRNGTIEAVDTHMLRQKGGRRTIPSTSFDEKLLGALPRFLLIQKGLGVEPPLFLMLSLLGVTGYTMAVPASFLGLENHPIDRDALLIPEVMIETFDCDATQVMRPLLDAVWNAAGWPQSINFNEDGKWVRSH